jgi:sodium-dependent dicarboxylate transporter 2/3/5
MNHNDALFDVHGDKTGLPLDKKRMISIGIAIGLFIVGALLPLSTYGENAALALGLVLFVITLWVSNTVPLLVPGICLAVGSVLLNILTLNDVNTTLGSSAIYPMMGLTLVSMGAENTNVTKRLSYFLLDKLGKRPSLILLAITIAGTVISAFVSNIATTIMLGGIAAGILSSMGEVPGNSKFGKALMILCPVSAAVGGAALVNGSPAINATGITILEGASGMSVSYVEWAKIGVPCALLVILPAWIIYTKTLGVKDAEVSKGIDVDYFINKRKELGAISGSEIRWLVTVAVMLFFLLRGLPLPVAGLLFGLISVAPVIGTVDGSTAFKKLPWEAIIMCGMIPLFGTIFTSTGLADYFGSLITPLIDGAPMFVIILVPALIMVVINSIFVNCGGGVLAICVGATAPIIAAMGYNPVFILLPTIFLANLTITFGTHIQMMLTYGYNYWDMKDPILPGFLFSFAAAIIYSVVTVIVVPMTGMSFYL